MEFPVPLKVEEDPEVFIDLDTEGNSPEDIVIEWHLEIRRLFARDVEANGDMKLISVMKDYITAIAERAIHFENIEKLETVVDKHIEHIYWLYTDWNLNMCFTEVYLQQMEHIMTFYVNLTLRILLGMKEKKKVTPKDVAYNAQKIINRLSSFLLQNEYHIFHVLIRQCTTAVDDMVKDVLNILNSNICKHLFKSLYMYFLFYAPVSDLSDEAFCRVYILFENWKAFEENIQKEQMELCLRNIFRRGTECIDGNEFLMKILRPQSSLMSELMKVVACDPLITKAYFDYIKSKDKSDTDDLDDISRLDLDDQRASDSEEAENDYNTRYTQLLKKMAKNDKELPVDISSEVKEEILVRSESPFIQNEIEVTISDSDSDSDLEIVSIIPSRNWSSQPISDDAENVYPGRKENPPMRKKPSFLESICIDVDNNRRPISRKQESGKSNGAQAIKSFDASKPCNRSQIINRNNKEPSKLGIVENVFHEKSLIVNSERSQTKAKASLESSRRKPIESQSSFLKDKQWRSKSREGESVEVGNSWHSQVQIESLEVNTAWPSRSNANETSCKSPQIETIEVSDSTQVVSLEVDKSYNKINSSEQSQTQKKSCEPCPAAAMPNQSSAVSPQIASSEVDTSLHPTTQRNEIEQNETLEVNSEKNVPLQKDLMDVDDSLHKQTQENKSVEPSSELNTSCQTKPKTNNPFETWRSQTKLNGWRSLEFNNTRSRLSGIEIFPSRKELKESCSSEREGMKNTSGTSPTRKTDSSQQDSEESATSYSSQGKISETSETSKIKNNETPCESSQIDSMEIDISVSQVKAGEMLHKFRQLYPPQRKRTDVLPTSRIIESDSDAQINEIGTTTIETCTTSEISELQSDQTNGIDDLTSKKPQMKTNERMTVSKTNEVMALSQLMSPEPSNLPDTENPSSSELEIREVASQPSCRQNQLESLNEEKDHSPPQTPQSDNDLDREILALDNLHLFENEKQDTSSVEKLRDVEVMPNNPQIKVNTVFNINKTVEETESTVEKSPIRNGYLTTKISSDKLGSGKLVKTNGSFKTIRENEKNPETTKKIELSNENEDERYPREETLCSKCSRENNLISDKSPNSEIIKRQQNTQNKFRSNGQLKKFVIDTGQGLPPQPVDTGQLQHFASTSADMKTPSEENFAAKTSMIKSGIVNCSEDQVMVAGDAETCQFGFPTPPGSEEDNDEQTNPVYSGILRTELGESSTCSASHTNSDSNLLQTVDEITLSALNGPLVQTLSVVPETIHSEIVINERTCHGEEKISERRCSNTDLGKYYEQFVKDAVGSQNSDDEEYLEPDHQAQTSSKAPPSDSEDIFEDMSQFLKCCDVTQSSTSPHRRRKGMVKVANESISSSERSPSRTKKRVTINDRPSFDDFEDELWDRPKSNKETDSPEPRLDEVATDPDEAETRRPSRRKSITKEKPSELPLSKYRTRRNGSNTNIPLSGSPPEQPRLKGILKKVEQKHSYHPLHPVDDEIDHTFIFIPYQPRSGKGKRGLVGSGMVKVFRKSFTAYKVSTNDFKLRLYPVVSIERLSPNTLLVWERVTRRSRGYICEEVPSTQPDKPMYKIVFDKSTLQLNSNDKKYYCDPSVSDDSSAFTQSKNLYQKTENEAGSVNLSSEIACNQPPPEIVLEPPSLSVKLLSPCMSPSSNGSSEFSDDINLISYQDIERALQVVEPDKSNESADKSDSSQVESELDGALVDNISVETINLLSNNADFHKIFCGLDGEILIENVPVLDTDETEIILNNSGSFLKSNSRADVCLPDKLSDELIVNLNSDEQLLKEVCRELESKSLVDALQTDSHNSIAGHSTEVSAIPPLEIVISDVKTPSVSVDHSEFERSLNESIVSEIKEQTLNVSFPHVSDKVLPSIPTNNNSFCRDHNEMSRKRLPKELLTIDSQLNESIIDFKIADSNVERPVRKPPEFESIGNQNYRNANDPSCDRPFNNVGINEICSDSQTTVHDFSNSCIGQPLICTTREEPFYHESVRPSLMVNLPISPESLEALSLRKSIIQRNSNNIPSHLNVDVPPINSNEAFYNSVNCLQSLPQVVEPVQQDVGIPCVVATQAASHSEISAAPNIHIRNAFIFPQAKAKTGKKRGRPPKNAKKTLDNHQQSVSESQVKQPNIPNVYHERVPPMYIPEPAPRSVDVPSVVDSDFNTPKNQIRNKTSKPESVSVSYGNNDAHCSITPLPMPVPQTFNFETDTLKKEVYNNSIIESNKPESSENDAEFETHLPLKKRKLSMPTTVPLQASEISYPATPMLSIADVYIPPRQFKTPAEKKQLPPDSPPVPICYESPSCPAPFTCSMNTFTSAMYHLSDCPFNIKMDCSPYCPPPPVIFPHESFSRSN